MTAINIFSPQLLVSVMAGATIEQLVERTATSVVRAMPNAAIEIGQSYTPWYSRYLSLAHGTLVEDGECAQLSKCMRRTSSIALWRSGSGYNAIATSMIKRHKSMPYRLK